jgi:hypothetical protein
MSKFVDRKDLERLFGPFGEIKDIRMNLDDEGHIRGAAFIEFADEVGFPPSSLLPTLALMFPAACVTRSRRPRRPSRGTTTSSKSGGSP